LRQVVPFGIAATSSLYGIEGFHLKDILGIIAVAAPESMHTRGVSVDVETQGELTRGMSVFDRRSWLKTSPNVNMVTEVDVKAVRDYVSRIIGY
jgi:inosine-uridine nucleoside N-ribohydrolase